MATEAAVQAHDIYPRSNTNLTIFPLFEVYTVFVPGFAAPYWIVYKNSAGNGHAGLWRVSTLN